MTKFSSSTTKGGIEIQGMKEINLILKKLPATVHAKALQSVHRTAANKVVKAEMIANAPEGAKKHIKVGVDKENPTGVTVGIKKSGFKYRWQEYGTEIRKTEKGAGRGKVREKPFIRPAIDAAAQPVIKFISDNYGELIGKFLKRNIRSVNKKIAK
jgi:HK97 gp10 family phage protein